MKWTADQLKAAPIIFIHGSEGEMRRDALAKTLEACETGPEDFDFQKIVADEMPASEWIGGLSTIPFFSERRTVLLRNALRLDPKELKLAVPPSGRLILVADEEGGSEDRAARLTTIAKNWAALVKSASGINWECSFEGKSLVPVLADAVKSRGKKLSPKAAELLQEMVGGSYSRAMGEMDKLILYVGDRQEIQEADVKALVVPNREWSIWTLVDAIAQNRVGEALRQLRIVLGSRTRIEEAANRSILPMLARQIRLIWQARVILDAGERPPQVSAAVRAMLPEKSILQERDFVVNKTMRQAQHVSIANCIECMEMLALADSQLKGQSPSAGALDTLETLIIGMAGKLAR